MTTAIEWTDYTVQPGLYGCSKASPACENCYAMSMAARQPHMARARGDATGGPYKGATDHRRQWTGSVKVDFGAIAPAFEKLPKKRPARVFVTSMSDLFHVGVPDEFILQVFDEMRARPHLSFQVLSKRPDRMAAWAADVALCGPWTWPANVWAGCTVEDQRRADERIPHLLRVPARVRFLSCEPLLGPVDLTEHLSWSRCWLCGRARDGALSGQECRVCDEGTMRVEGTRIHWVITGSESLGKREGRPTDPAWTRAIRDQCVAAGVPFFLKQAAVAGRVVSAPELDGQRWQQFPEAA